MEESSPSERDKEHVKKGLASVFKAVAGIAGLVFFMAPITNMGILVSVIALVVAIITGVLGVHLSGGETHSGHWPQDPSSRGSL